MQMRSPLFLIFSFCLVSDASFLHADAPTIARWGGAAAVIAGLGITAQASLQMRQLARRAALLKEQPSSKQLRAVQRLRARAKRKQAIGAGVAAAGIVSVALGVWKRKKKSVVAEGASSVIEALVPGSTEGLARREITIHGFTTGECTVDERVRTDDFREVMSSLIHNENDSVLLMPKNTFSVINVPPDGLCGYSVTCYFEKEQVRSSDAFYRVDDRQDYIKLVAHLGNTLVDIVNEINRFFNPVSSEQSELLTLWTLINNDDIYDVNFSEKMVLLRNYVFPSDLYNNAYHYLKKSPSCMSAFEKNVREYEFPRSMYPKTNDEYAEAKRYVHSCGANKIAAISPAALQGKSFEFKSAINRLVFLSVPFKEISEILIDDWKRFYNTLFTSGSRGARQWADSEWFHLYALYKKKPLFIWFYVSGKEEFILRKQNRFNVTEGMRFEDCLHVLHTDGNHYQILQPISKETRRYTIAEIVS